MYEESLEEGEISDFGDELLLKENMLSLETTRVARGMDRKQDVLSIHSSSYVCVAEVGPDSDAVLDKKAMNKGGTEENSYSRGKTQQQIAGQFVAGSVNEPATVAEESVAPGLTVAGKGAEQSVVEWGNLAEGELTAAVDFSSEIATTSSAAELSSVFATTSPEQLETSMQDSALLQFHMEIMGVQTSLPTTESDCTGIAAATLLVPAAGNLLLGRSVAGDHAAGIRMQQVQTDVQPSHEAKEDLLGSQSTQTAVSLEIFRRDCNKASEQRGEDSTINLLVDGTAKQMVAGRVCATKGLDTNISTDIKHKRKTSAAFGLIGETEPSVQNCLAGQIAGTLGVALKQVDGMLVRPFLETATVQHVTP